MSQQTQSAILVFIGINNKTMPIVLQKNDSRFSFPIPEHMFLTQKTMQDGFDELAQFCNVNKDSTYGIEFYCVRSSETFDTDSQLVHRLTSAELSHDKSFLDFLIEKYSELV